MTQQFDWKIPIRALELTQILGQPCEFQVDGAGGGPAAATDAHGHLRARIRPEGDGAGCAVEPRLAAGDAGRGRDAAVLAESDSSGSTITR